MTEQYSQCNLHRWSSSNPTKACPTCCKNQNFIIDFVVCITELERENATMAKAQEESWAENARLRKALEQIADTPHMEGGSGEQMAKMFDVKEVRQKIDHSLFDDTFEVMDVLTTACDRIEALERENAAMAKVVEAARAFYLNHEHLGWGGHEKIGEALAALAPELKP